MTLSRPALVFCGPSGVGKSTILKHLFKKYPDTFKFSVSRMSVVNVYHPNTFVDTTRSPREGEQCGREYHFVTHEVFEAMVAEEKFIEHTRFASNCYGTSKQAIQDVQAEGKQCILDLDWQGVLSVRRLKLDARVVFIKPPSISALRDRLSQRGTESTDSLDQRLKSAEEDLLLQEKNEDLCDLILVNDDINEACRIVEEFIFNA